MLPPHTAITSLRASFSTTGKSVNVGDAVQESGVTANAFTSPVCYTVYDIVLPYGSVLTALKATFETTGDKVTVNGIVQESGLTQNDFSADVVYRVTAQDGSYNDYTVKASVAKNDARAITKFILDGQNSIIDESARSITVTFPSTKDITGLIATFISTGINVSVSGKDQVSGVTVNDFSSPLVYTVTAENGTTADYTVKVNKNADISGLWNFEQASDGTFTIEGAKTIAGAIGNALYFNRGDYVRVPDSDSLTLASEGSIEVIILAYSHKHYAGLVHKGVLKDFSDESYNLQFHGLNGTDGTLRFTLFNDSGAFAYVESTSKLAIDTWYYVAVTWDASAINLYVNGVLESSTANTAGKVRDSAGDLIIGHNCRLNTARHGATCIFTEL
jgi:hypothetical protein